MTLGITAIVLTLNEEKNISDCLESLQKFERRIVVDSGSTDDTIHLASRLGVDIYTNKPKGTFLFSEQRNWAVSNCSISTDWVLFIDADERVPLSLYQELKSFITSNMSRNIVACCLAPRYLFFNQWLRYCQHYPNWHPRLLRPSHVQFSGGMWETFQDLDGRPLLQSQISYIAEPYDHIAFSKGFDDWFLKHLRYASWDAQVVIDYLNNASHFDQSVISRKHTLRVLSIRLWFLRPILRFVHKFIFSMGFLDGWNGLLFCCLMSFYELLVVLKILEKRQNS